MARLQRLARDLQQSNERATITVIENFTRSRFRYLGETVETVRTVEKMLDTLEQTGKIIGDCDDVCVFLASLFRALKIPVKFTAIRTTPEPDFLHVFIKANGRIVDVTIHPKTVMRYYGNPMEVFV